MCWSAQQDSNLRSPGPKPGALAGLRYTPKVTGALTRVRTETRALIGRVLYLKLSRPGEPDATRTRNALPGTRVKAWLLNICIPVQETGGLEGTRTLVYMIDSHVLSPLSYQPM